MLQESRHESWNKIKKDKGPYLRLGLLEKIGNGCGQIRRSCKRLAAGTPASRPAIGQREGGAAHLQEKASIHRANRLAVRQRKASQKEEDINRH